MRPVRSYVDRVRRVVGVDAVRLALPAVVPALVLGFFLVRGYDGPDFPHVDRPEGAPAVTTTTAPPVAASAIALAPVMGTTTTAPIATTGSAHLRGTVVGPQGAVPGAIVHVERLVADQVFVTDLATFADGTWDLIGVPGGRYRVRAYLPPTLAQVEPEIFFLRGDEEKALDLLVESFTGVGAVASVAPDPPVLNRPFTFAVQVASRSVDASGVVRSQPLAGWQVEVIGGAGFVVRPPASAFSDASGRASFTLECRAAGADRVQVSLRGNPVDPPTVQAVTIPACFDPASTTTTTVPGTPTTSSGTSSSTTSTTR
jgi:hypothetical protein